MTVRIPSGQEALRSSIGRTRRARDDRLGFRDTLAKSNPQLVHRIPAPDAQASAVLGVKDWARRKGRTNDTIVVDLHRVVETHSRCTVANEANARGYRTKARVISRRDWSRPEVGSKRFDEDMVTAIVRNPIYKGFLRYKRSTFRRWPTSWSLTSSVGGSACLMWT
jgi:hypothetical protein